MNLRIQDIVADFTAQTTQGEIRFHEWIGDSYCILFSHPKDFTPVCTTELGAAAKLEGELKERNCKLIGLSIDPVDQHDAWAKDIEETQGALPGYPMIGDTDLNVAKLYNMLPADESGSSEGRTAATNATVRTVFIIGPDKKLKGIGKTSCGSDRPNPANRLSHPLSQPSTSKPGPDGPAHTRTWISPKALLPFGTKTAPSTPNGAASTKLARKSHPSVVGGFPGRMPW